MNDIFDDFPVVENGKLISPDLEDVSLEESKTFHLTTASGGASPQGEASPCPAGNGMAENVELFNNNPSDLAKPSQLPLHKGAFRYKKSYKVI